MNFNKKILAAAVGSVLGVSALAVNAATVTGITIQDTDSDGKAGRFGFNAFMTSNWTGDAGTGTLLGEGNANAAGSFSTGFLFSGAPFVPYTYGSGFNADITGTTLAISTLDFGGNYAGIANFNLPPDPGTLAINYVNDLGGGDYAVNFQWTHYITPTDDPSYSYVGFTAYWLVDGVAHTSAVPVPAAAYLFGSGLLGLAGVARRRRRDA